MLFLVFVSTLQVISSSMLTIPLKQTPLTHTRRNLHSLIPSNILPLQNYHNLQYTGKIYLGPEKQEFTVLFDTGSNWLWLPAQNITNSQNFPNRRECSINGTGSSCRLIVNTSQEVLQYGLGQVVGNKAIDWVGMGGDSNQIGYYFINSIQQTDLDGYNADGIFGLGFNMKDSEGRKYQNYIELLFQKGMIEYKMFSFYMGVSKKMQIDDVSQLHIGGFDPKFIENDQNLTFFPVKDKQYWAVDAQKISINGEVEITEPRRALLDTGTSLLMMPQQDFRIYLQYLKSKKINCKVQDNQRPICECPKGISTNYFPDIHFILQDENGQDQQFTIEPSQYIQQERNQCELFISHINLESDMEYWILGDQFLLKYYSIFDQENMRVALPRAKQFQKNEVIKNIGVFLGYSSLSIGLGLLSLAFINKFVLLKNYMNHQDQRLI